MEPNVPSQKNYSGEAFGLPDLIVGTANAFATPALEFFSALKKIDANAQAPGPISLARFSASATSLTLACELYLKAIFHASGIKAPWGHDLWTIYDALPDGYQAYIEHAFAASTVGQDLMDTLTFGIANKPHVPHPIAVPPAIHLVDLLKAEGDAFKDWRYVHEIAPPLNGPHQSGVLSYNVSRMVRLAAVLKDVFIWKDGRIIGTRRYNDEDVKTIANPVPTPIVPLPPDPVDADGNLIISPLPTYPPAPKPKR